MKRFLLLIASASLAFAQSQINMTTPPPPPVQILGVTQTGAQGAITYYYQVIVNFPAGAVLSATAPILTSNATLSVSNFNTISWVAVSGALSYDVLRFTTPAGYAGSTCTCAVATGQTGTSVNDQTNTLSSYVLNSLGSIGSKTVSLFVDNKNYDAPAVVKAGTGSTNLNIDPLMPMDRGLGVSWNTGVAVARAQLVKSTGPGTVGPLTTSDTAFGVPVGISSNAQIAGANNNPVVFTQGRVACQFDAGGGTAGNLAIVSTTAAGDCADSGQASVSSISNGLAVIGVIEANVAANGIGRVDMLMTRGGNGTAGTNCGTTAGACAGTSAIMKIVTGNATLTTGTPSTAAITGMPAFTSTTSYQCFAQDTTTVANNIGVLTAGYVSTTAVTFTGPNTNTDTFRYSCIGF